MIHGIMLKSKLSVWFFFFFRQKTAYDMRISDWIQTCALPILNVTGEVGSSSSSGGTGSSQSGAAGAAGGSRTEVTSKSNNDFWEQLKDNIQAILEIGRASCRERVCQYV